MSPRSSPPADEYFMRLALREAQRGSGRTSPNPAVGALVVKDGRIVGRGFHRKAGAPHAEVVALSEAAGRARGGELYTTLEPCDHYGRTPPCSKAILEAGIRRVISGSSDPNPLVRGRGLARLKRAGVLVATGVLQSQTDALNRPFLKAMKHKLPYVILKAAITLDGKLATGSGDSKWISSDPARQWVHALRDQVDAVLVGANTVRRDDPFLTTRLEGRTGRDAVRVILTSDLELNPAAHVIAHRSQAVTILATTPRAPESRAKRLLRPNVDIWRIPSPGRKVALRPLLEGLVELGLQSVLVEGGAEVFASFLKEGLADELAVFLTPKLVGAAGGSWVGDLGIARMADALPIRDWSVEPLGPDLLIRGTVERASGRSGRLRRHG